MSQTSTKSALPSEDAVNEIINDALFDKAPKAIGFGLCVGYLASVVIAKGGASNAARKGITAFGAGVGMGSAWTQANLDLETLLGKRSS